MNKKIWLLAVLMVLVITSGCGKSKKIEKNEYIEAFVGERSLSEYEIVYEGKGTKEIAKTLQGYISDTIGIELPIVSAKKDSEASNIHVHIYADRQYEGADISFVNGNIEIEGNADIFVEPKMYEFLNTYLGWMYSGTDYEARDIKTGTVRMPENFDALSKYSAFVSEREATVVLWKPNFTRGTVYNAETSNLTDVLSYTDEQIYEYVRMLKFCGFTGVQVTDMCSAWAGVSDWKFAQQQMRKYADAAHSLNMKFTLWVWAAEFNEFSWADMSVTYEKDEYEHAYENPEVIACFEKYYDIYAELADCSDRVIAHYSDPGNLKESEDVAFFSHLLMDKMKEKNPNVDFGLDCWNAPISAEELVSELGTDITIYENSHPDLNAGANLRRSVEASGARLGTWSWGTAEMETDQLAQMNYNAGFISNTYRNMLQYDYIKHTEYWSEMDAYHLLNVFSLYTAGHLLQTPLEDTDKFTLEIAEATVGPENATQFARVLRLIEKARTGESADTFDWDSDNYILKSEQYPKGEILKECAELIPFVEKLIENGAESYSLPLPVSLTDLLKLILPHLKQIEQYAEFRMTFDEAIAKCESGIIEKDKLTDIIKECGDPIPEYNCTIGLWGQIEARAQRQLVLEACGHYEIEVPIYGWYDAIRKDRILSAFKSEQLGRDYPVLQVTYQYTCAYGEETDRLIDEMVEDGILTRDDSGMVYVTNWEDYIYNFNG